MSSDRARRRHARERQTARPARPSQASGLRLNDRMVRIEIRSTNDLVDAREAVLRLAELARMVAHLDLRQARCGQRRHGRDEPVHLGVERDALDQVGPVGLERAAIVLDRHAGHPARSASWRPSTAARATSGPGARGASRRRDRSPRRSCRGTAGCRRGSFCRSPSMVTSTWPRAWSMPATMAVVWPALRRSLTRRRCGIVCAAARARARRCGRASRRRRRRSRSVGRAARTAAQIASYIRRTLSSSL